MQLRDYQMEMDAAIDNAWRTGAKNVCAVLPTGAGKTVIFANKMSQNDGYGFAIAHRQELVSQISMALARFGIFHDILAPRGVIQFITQQHLSKLGQVFYRPGSLSIVAGVMTLLRRADKLRNILPHVKKWTIDECHHVTKENQWGKAVALFPNALGLGVTATPTRADGQGLGSHHDGVMDVLINGPSMRELIGRGFLTDYKIYAPPTDVDFSDVPISQATGDYVKSKLNTKFANSKIIGDIVEHYKKFAEGKTGVTFVPSVAAAGEVAGRFNSAGIPAEVVSAKTPDNIRAACIDKLKRRELLQLVNVDLFGEGFDLPAIECVSMARPTESYSLFVQQFGRSMRPCEGKKHAIIIDHVGNVKRHGLPDRERVFTLDRRERAARSKRDPDLIPTKTCIECAGVYEAIFKKCPHCGFIMMPEDRSQPEFVDGDLIELSPQMLMWMRGEIEKIDVDESVIAAKYNGMDKVIKNSLVKNHSLRKQAQQQLRASIAQWAGYLRAAGASDSEIYKRFFFRFGMDIMTAQTLGRPDAEKLNAEVISNYGSFI